MPFYFDVYNMFLGEYWIDPNEGDIKDAILVYCDMETKASCVFPKPEKSPILSYEKRDQEVWLGEMQSGMKVYNT